MYLFELFVRHANYLESEIFKAFNGMQLSDFRAFWIENCIEMFVKWLLVFFGAISKYNRVFGSEAEANVAMLIKTLLEHINEPTVLSALVCWNTGK